MRDFLTRLVGDLGAGGMDFLAVEFVGETIDNASLADRITLCSMVTEMSGKVPLIMPSGEVLKWLVERAGPEVEKLAKEFKADPDAEYCKVLKYDVTNALKNLYGVGFEWMVEAETIKPADIPSVLTDKYTKKSKKNNK